MKEDDKTKREIEKLQLLEQNLQGFLAQKQQFQGQIIEIDSALEELKKSKDAFKMVGNLMVKRDSKSLTEELEKNKEVLNLRISSIESQEKKIREKSESIRKEIMKG